jgi:DNA-binding HxlR family transcriptional regulator
MGQDLYGLGLMIRRWGRGVNKAKVTPIHRQCGRKMMKPEAVCANCGNAVIAGQTDCEDRGSANDEPYAWLRRQRRSKVTSSQVQNPGPFEHALDILGDRWTYLVVAAAFYGIRRFTAFADTLGIATNILSDRLTRLVEAKIFEHLPASDRSNVYECHLTEKGRDLFPVIVALLQWGDTWLLGSRKPSLIFRHQPCGRRLKCIFICDICGRSVRYADIIYQPQPSTRGDRAKIEHSNRA